MNFENIIELHKYYNAIYDKAEKFYNYLEKNNLYSNIVYNTRNGFNYKNIYYEQKYHIPEIEMMANSSIIFNVTGIEYHFWSVKKYNLEINILEYMNEINKFRDIQINSYDDNMNNLYEKDYLKTYNNMRMSFDENFRISIMENDIINIKNEEILQGYLENYGIIFGDKNIIQK
ncbi:hypothetical protein OF820_10500 [Oceanotoga sp. DSM 15011]|jgi:hypothetical protein|uniref:hypothetical protein n=1 Tax=Oceanotoga sp. DSM 15011 TaxID=2984951 RepID=UPI0021F4793A|nr:hypothetical protein [Oceanotoga sp. DSM 15011]UYO99498.1 hypothetical protein OF820_10500 [Oceanotoga sp. DSM 15011]